MKTLKPIYQQAMNRPSLWQKVLGPDGETVGWVHKVKGGWQACDSRKRPYDSRVERSAVGARETVADEWVLSGF
jgi:hypothetical protein